MSREIYVFADWEVFEKPTLATWDKVAPISYYRPQHHD
jgi:hypothetical protein